MTDAETDAVTDAFSDLSLGDAFDAYIDLVAPKDASAIMRAIVQEAFYAGAIATFGMAIQPERQDDVGVELAEFIDSTKERVARARPH